jgi:hypothetical protein
MDLKPGAKLTVIAKGGVLFLVPARPPREFRGVARRLSTQSPGKDFLPLALDAYIDLLAATGAAMCTTGPSPAFPERSVRTLQRLGIRSELWFESLRHYRYRFFTMVGCVHIPAEDPRILEGCSISARWRVRGGAIKPLSLPVAP